jgi:hypothetical protein
MYFDKVCTYLPLHTTANYVQYLVDFFLLPKSQNVALPFTVHITILMSIIKKEIKAVAKVII